MEFGWKIGTTKCADGGCWAASSRRVKLIVYVYVYVLAASWQTWSGRRVARSAAAAADAGACIDKKTTKTNRHIPLPALIASICANAASKIQTQQQQHTGSPEKLLVRAVQISQLDQSQLILRQLVPTI